MMESVSRQESKHKSLGFTLIELLVVVVILGVLAAVGLGAYLSGQTKARDARRKNDLKSITAALEAYYNDTRSYPQSSSGQIMVDGCSLGVCSWGSEMKDSVGTTYMVQLPQDPRSSWDYCYVDQQGGQAYLLLARLENSQDSIIPQVGGQNGYYLTADLGCSQVVGSNYNYVVASSNATLPTAELEP